MAMKLTTGFAFIAALLTLSLIISDNAAGAFNASSAGGGLSVGLIVNHGEGSIYSTQRGSHGFLYLRRRHDSRRLSSASSVISEAHGSTTVVLRVGSGSAQHE
ncbi:unnamed protein product [Urochloa humidicola]